jgi:hypothetical protein
MAKRGELQNLDRSHFAEIVSGRTDLDKQQVERMVDTLQSTWSKFLGEYQPAKGTEAQVTAGGRELAPAEMGPSSEGVAAKYKRFKDFLHSTGRAELSPERLEQEVKTLVLDPKGGISQLKEHAKELDRESLVQALSQRKDMTAQEAANIADQIDLARSKALSTMEQAEHRSQEIKDRVLSKIRDRIYAVNRPELDYEGFAGDFKKLLDDPKAGYAALKTRLQGIDRETLISLLSTGEGMKMDRGAAEKLVEKGEAVKGAVQKASDQAKSGMEKIADQFMEAKETVLERARKVEEETERRLEQAKLMAMEQAEAARKVTAAAAWWLLAIAVISGAAAALGGLTAAGT